MIGVVEGGKLVHSWSIQRDVTERVKLGGERTRAEKGLRASELHFRLLFEQASDGIFISDAEGHYEDVNSAGAEMLGYTREEILQFFIPDIVTGEDRGRVDPELARTGRNRYADQRVDISTQGWLNVPRRSVCEAFAGWAWVQGILRVTSASENGLRKRCA